MGEITPQQMLHAMLIAVKGSVLFSESSPSQTMHCQNRTSPALLILQTH